MNGGSVMGDLNASGWDLALVLVLGVVLAGVVRVLRFALDVAPLAADRREALRRAFPLVSGVGAVLYLLLSAGIVFERYPAHFPIAVAVILGVAIAASWFALRDVVSGLIIKAGRVCRVGDHVRIGEIEGRVMRMGLRVLEVETARGAEAILPYSEVARVPVLRTPVSEQGTQHVFALDLPGRPPVAETKRRIRQGAMLCHWAAITREPEVTVLAADRFEVTIFALDSDHVREVEDAVRRALSSA